MKKIIILLFLAVSVVISGCAVSERGVPQAQKLHEEDHIMDLPMEEISASEVEALSLAINDEYKARATYERVLEKFGDVRPFSNIISSEESHISQLKELYEKYSLNIPEDDWYDTVPVFDSVLEACEAGVDAEVENAALYDELFSMVDNQDITEVFTSLRDASETKHLPAFQNCGGLS